MQVWAEQTSSTNVVYADKSKKVAHEYFHFVSSFLLHVYSHHDWQLGRIWHEYCRYGARRGKFSWSICFRSRPPGCVSVTTTRCSIFSRTLSSFCRTSTAWRTGRTGWRMSSIRCSHHTRKCLRSMLPSLGSSSSSGPSTGICVCVWDRSIGLSVYRSVHLTSTSPSVRLFLLPPLCPTRIHSALHHLQRLLTQHLYSYALMHVTIFWELEFKSILADTTCRFSMAWVLFFL